MNNNTISPKVSVITVCRNCKDDIERTIKSVLSQRYDNVEYIIIDGASTDGTLEIIDRYKENISCLISEPDSGIYDAQNKGIRCSSGEIICLLNSSDIFFDTATIAEAVEYLEKTIADFIYGNILSINEDGSEAKLSKFPRRLKKRFFLKGPLAHSSTFFKRKCFQLAGYYNREYKIAADYEWYLRAIYKYGLCPAYLDKTISVFKEGGFSSNIQLRLAEMRKIIKVYFTRPERISGKIANFILSMDIFRLIGRVVLTGRGYQALRKIRRKFFAKKFLPV